MCRLEQNEVEMHNFLHDYSSNGTFGTRCIYLLVFWLLIRNRKLFLIIWTELHLPKHNYLVTRPCPKPFFNEFGKIFFQDKKCSWNRAPFLLLLCTKSTQVYKEKKELLQHGAQWCVFNNFSLDEHRHQIWDKFLLQF